MDFTSSEPEAVEGYGELGDDNAEGAKITVSVLERGIFDGD